MNRCRIKDAKLVIIRAVGLGFLSKEKIFSLKKLYDGPRRPFKEDPPQGKDFEQDEGHQCESHG